MRSRYGWLIVLLALWGLVACGGGEPTLTAELLPTVADVAIIPTLTPTLIPTLTPSPTPTATPTLTPTSVVQFAPTSTPTGSPTPRPTLIPFVAPGTAVGDILEPNQPRVYSLQATARQPLYLMTEGVDELDLALAVYDMDVITFATETNEPIPSFLANNAPDRVVQLNGAGFPELMIYTPDEDGTFSIGVGGVDGTAGAFRLYVFDPYTITQHTSVASTETIPAGGSKSYAVRSYGKRPVAIFARPLDGNDVAIVIKKSDGEQISRANFAGASAAELTFYKPGGSVPLTIEIQDVGGRGGRVQLIIATPR
jgi:hypothetical protein